MRLMILDSLIMLVIIKKYMKNAKYQMNMKKTYFIWKKIMKKRKK